MVHYLKNEDGKTVVDAQTTGPNDFSVVVCIDAFGPMLLNVERGMSAIRMISEFNDIQELRGKYFEGGYAAKGIKADDFLKDEFMEIVEKYKLAYVTD